MTSSKYQLHGNRLCARSRRSRWRGREKAGVMVQSARALPAPVVQEGQPEAFTFDAPAMSPRTNEIAASDSRCRWSANPCVRMPDIVMDEWIVAFGDGDEFRLQVRVRREWGEEGRSRGSLTSYFTPPASPRCFLFLLSVFCSSHLLLYCVNQKQLDFRLIPEIPHWK